MIGGENIRLSFAQLIIFFARYLGNINDICNTIKKKKANKKKLLMIRRNTPLKRSPRHCVYFAPTFPEVTHYALNIQNYIFIFICAHSIYI